MTASVPVSVGRAVAPASFSVGSATVYFDHPLEVPLDHALCIDFRSDDPARRLAVELDAASARRLATEILAILDHPEVVALR